MSKPFLIFLFSVLLQSCNNSKPTEKDFVGLWKSNDGATIELKEDGSYSANQINYYNFFFDKELQNKTIDFTGTWSLIEARNGKRKVELKSNKTYQDFGVNKNYTINGESHSHKIGVSFEISGQGAFENTPPWELFVWIGDPGDARKYKFQKK